MNFLEDPKNDRQVKELPLPPLKPLPDDLLFPVSFKGKMYIYIYIYIHIYIFIYIYIYIYITIGKPNWKLLRDHFFREGKIQKNHVLKIIN